MRYASYQQQEHHGTDRHRLVEDIGGHQVHFGDDLLIFADDTDWEGVVNRARHSGINLTESKNIQGANNVYLVRQKGRLFEAAFPNAQIIHDSGRFLAVSMSDEEYAQAARHDPICFKLSSLPTNGVVFERRAHRSSRRVVPDWVRALVDDVSMDEYHTVLQQLVSFPTRHSLSDHYRSAAEFCRNHLLNLGYQTRVQEVPLGAGFTSNIIAEKHGVAAERKLVIAMAHLDSINLQGDIGALAPGADDNGSGSAAIIEIARVLQHHAPEHDLQLVLFGGEELGLLGSEHYVSELEQTDRTRLIAALNMDMIASRNLDIPTVLIEAGERPIVDALADAADTYTGLRVETSLNPFASDHVPFIDVGLPAALTIEGADARNDNIHTANDTLSYINTELACEVIRMNLGFMAENLGKACLANGKQPSLFE